MPYALTSGGQSRTHLFPVKYDSASGTYKFYDIPGGTLVATPTVSDAFQLDAIQSSKPAFNDDGTFQLGWDQLDSGKTIMNFLDMVAIPLSSSAGLPSYKLENKIEVGGTSGASGYQVLVVSYLQEDPDEGTGGEIMALVGLATVAASSGGFETNPEDYNKVTMSVTGAKAQANLPVTAAMFDDTIISTASAATQIDKDASFVRPWNAVAA